MSVQISTIKDEKFVKVHVSEKLTKEDYQHLVPEMERLIKERGKVRLLFEMSDFHGWEASALWEDIKFDLKHFSDFDRLAVVGEKKWQEGMTHFCRPFTTAKIRYFDHSQADEARTWLESD